MTFELVGNDYLPKLLKDRGIKSFDSLHSKLESDNSDNFLAAETKESLGLDSENRIYDEEIGYRKKLFLTDLVLKNATNISFVDTIIEGNLIILDAGHILTKVNFDYVIAKEKVVLNLSEKVSKISLYGLNCKELVIRNGEGCSLDISNSTIFDLYIEETTLCSFRCSTSKIGKFSVNNFKTNDVDFDHGQIDLSLLNHNEKSSKYLTAFEQFNLFEFASAEEVIDQLSKKSSFGTSRDTLNFLNKNSDIYTDKKGFSKVRSLYSKLYRNNSPGSYVLMCLAGHFVRPWLFLVYLFGFILLFAAGFTLCGAQFSVGKETRVLCFLEALYFSGITITTTGYGDITPTGVARIFAVIESILGVFLMSSYVVTLYRKYVER